MLFSFYTNFALSRLTCMLFLVGSNQAPLTILKKTRFVHQLLYTTTSDILVSYAALDSPFTAASFTLFHQSLEVRKSTTSPERPNFNSPCYIFFFADKYFSVFFGISLATTALDSSRVINNWCAHLQ